MVLKFLQNSQGNTFARISFLLVLKADAWNFIKKRTLAQVFSCEFCKNLKNTFFDKTPLFAASDYKYFILKGHRNSRPEVLCEKGVLENFTKLAGKHLYQSLFFNKAVGLAPSGVISYNLRIYHLPTKPFGKAKYPYIFFIVIISYRKDNNFL